MTQHAAILIAWAILWANNKYWAGCCMLVLLFLVGNA